MCKKVKLGLPVSISTLVSVERETATTIRYEGNFGNERLVNITSEDDKYVHCTDYITGQELRISHRYIKEIALVDVLRREVNTTDFHNYNHPEPKYKATSAVQYFVFPEGTDVEMLNEFNHNNKEGLYYTIARFTDLEGNKTTSNVIVK